MKLGTACHEELIFNRGTVKAHICSAEKFKSQREPKESIEYDLLEFLKFYDKKVQPSGTTVSMEIEFHLQRFLFISYGGKFMSLTIIPILPVKWQNHIPTYMNY